MYKEISDDEYHSLDYISQSYLKNYIDLNWAQAQESIKNQKEKKSSSLNFGSVAHSYILQDIDLSGFNVYEKIDGRSKAGKEQQELVNSSGKYISKKDMDSLIRMKENFNSSKHAVGIMNRSVHIEKYGIVDIQNGVKMKFRPDIICDGLIVDYKTIGDFISKKSVGAAIKNYLYNFQAAAYISLHEKLTEESCNFCFIFQEKIPPYGVAIVYIDNESLQSGYDKFNMSLNCYLSALNDESLRSPNCLSPIEISVY